MTPRVCGMSIFVIVASFFSVAARQREGHSHFLSLRSQPALEAQVSASEAEAENENAVIVQDLHENLEGGSASSEVTEGVAPAPIFVAVFSARGNWYRRHTVRKALRYGRHSHPYLRAAQFVLCNNASADRTHGPTLDFEQRKYGDVLLIDCTEGLERTLLTRKLIEMMRVYNSTLAKDYKYFMRVDDDTFVSWNRLQRLLAGAGEYAYVGSAVKAGRPVNRDMGSPWYQPEDSYPAQVYPLYMVKGQGYLLSNALLGHILESGVATENILSNEDQAVGVWVDKVKQSGVNVEMVEVPGVDGNVAGMMAAATWSQYPWTLHHRIKSDSINCLAAVDADGNSSRGIGDCFVDTMFVAVFSARANFEKRAHLRNTLSYAEGVNKRATVRFVLCDEQDEYSETVALEVKANKDAIVLPCKEGYAPTLLTLKLIASLEIYLRSYGDHSLFMKVDDDTFVSWSRIRKWVSEQSQTDVSYIGILGPDHMKVNRDNESAWYQPPDVYPNETYPPIMEGGPGYIVGGELVRRLFAASIPHQHLLSNEDQALGVWMDILKRSGSPVNMMSIPGTDGYKPEFDTCFGSWAEYPFFLHHKLEPSTITCLAQVEQSGDPSKPIDACFPDCVKLTATALNGRLTDMFSEVRVTLAKLQTLESDLTSLSQGMHWVSQKIANSSAFEF